MSKLQCTYFDGYSGVGVTYEGFAPLVAPTKLDPSFCIAIVWLDGGSEQFLVEGKQGADNLLACLRERHDSGEGDWIAPPVLIMPLNAAAVESAKRQWSAITNDSADRANVWNSLTEGQRHAYMDLTDPNARRRLWQRYVTAYNAIAPVLS